MTVIKKTKPLDKSPNPGGSERRVASFPVLDEQRAPPKAVPLDVLDKRPVPSTRSQAKPSRDRRPVGPAAAKRRARPSAPEPAEAAPPISEGRRYQQVACLVSPRSEGARSPRRSARSGVDQTHQ